MGKRCLFQGGTCQIELRQAVACKIQNTQMLQVTEVKVDPILNQVASKAQEFQTCTSDDLRYNYSTVHELSLPKYRL